MTAHIRKRVSRARPRVGYLRNPGVTETLCGSASTTGDLSLRDALTAPAEWMALHVCPSCLTALPNA